jgi:hypothetical protein
MFGICPVSMLSGVGWPWFVGTDVVHKHPLPMVRVGRWYVAEARRRYQRVWGLVDVRYTSAIRWAGLIGFRLGGPIEYRGAIFVPIEARA